MSYLAIGFVVVGVYMLLVRCVLALFEGGGEP